MSELNMAVANGFELYLIELWQTYRINLLSLIWRTTIWLRFSTVVNGYIVTARLSISGAVSSNCALLWIPKTFWIISTVRSSHKITSIKSTNFVFLKKKKCCSGYKYSTLKKKHLHCTYLIYGWTHNEKDAKPHSIITVTYVRIIRFISEVLSRARHQAPWPFGPPS